MKEAVEKLGGLDTLVNNAGILGSFGNNIETTSLETWSCVIQTNLTSAFLLTQYVLSPPSRFLDVILLFPPPPHLKARSTLIAIDEGRSKVCSAG